MKRKNISIAPAEDGAVIERVEGFNDAMFKVSGESAFQFEGAQSDGTILNLTVKGISSGAVTGPVVTMDSGYFGISDGVTITGCNTMSGASVIYNTNGKIGLAGGNITGNQSLDQSGAIYSEGEIRVSGNVVVNGNKDDGYDDNSIVLNGDNAYIAAVGALGDNADLQVIRKDAADGKDTCTIR